MKTILIFFGPPGSGKGTQADLLSQKTGWKKISTGDLLRSETALKSPLGKQAEKYMKAGKLVPDKLLIDLVAKSLKQKTEGFIFDGYPRNIEQQKALSNMFEKCLKKNDQVVSLLVDVSDKEIKHRLSQRRVCSCGAIYHLKYNPPINKGICDVCRQKLFIRDDDEPKIINHRLKIYHQNSEPIFDYWQQIGKLIKINGEQPIAKIHKEILQKLKELKLIIL
ncbi:MAG: nucleoside monophosphate kinase [bacterium]|nr:nucleoside monophosphate kinase [bacterium]